MKLGISEILKEDNAQYSPQCFYHLFVGDGISISGSSTSWTPRLNVADFALMIAKKLNFTFWRSIFLKPRFWISFLHYDYTRNFTQFAGNRQEASTKYHRFGPWWCYRIQLWWSCITSSSRRYFSSQSSNPRGNSQSWNVPSQWRVVWMLFHRRLWCSRTCLGCDYWFGADRSSGRLARLWPVLLCPSKTWAECSLYPHDVSLQSSCLKK